jgi:Arc/MetJ-type ribon-helix-helix transcriptional regulator
MTQSQLIRKSFTLTARDVEMIKLIREKCGFVSESEALRAALRFFYEHAACVKT